MNETFSKMTEGIKDIPISYGIPEGGLLPDPQHTLQYWRCSIREMERNIKRYAETFQNALKVIVDRKIDNYYKIHGERANIIVIAPFYRHSFPFLEYRDIPIIYSLNLSTKEEWSDDSIQVF